MLQALVLGVVQGATEFLPVSSSAHLVLVPWVLGWEFNPQAAFIFDVLVQLGTLLAVVVYFARDLWRLLTAAARGLSRGRPWAETDARLAWLLLLATLPAAAAGVLAKDWVEAAFSSPAAVAGFLLVTAGLLLLAERQRAADRVLPRLTPLDALWIGLAQALALFPGISRSGSTIAGGRMRHLSRPEAAHFSFLMAVPVMIGAGLVASGGLVGLPAAGALIAPLTLGFLAAAASGYLAIRWLLRYLARRPLTPFAVYCGLLGLAMLLLSLLRAGGLG
ncbi:MAG: undecaprenyl-diphosphatase UppP [Chloroflexota bacterium]